MRKTDRRPRGIVRIFAGVPGEVDRGRAILYSYGILNGTGLRMRPRGTTPVHHGNVGWRVLLRGFAFGATLCPAFPATAAGPALSPQEELIRAMTLCPEPNNPITNGIRVLGGDLLVNVRILRAPDPVVLVADVVASPRALDPSDRTPDAVKGRIRVEIGFRPEEAGRRVFYCRLEVFPAPS